MNLSKQISTIGVFNDGAVKIVHKVIYLGTPDELYLEESRYDVKRVGPFKRWVLTGRDMVFLPVYAFSALEALYNEDNNKVLKDFRKGELKRYKALAAKQLKELDAMTTEDVYHEVGKVRFMDKVEETLKVAEFDLGTPTAVHKIVSKYFTDHGMELICKSKNGLTYDFTFLQPLGTNEHVKIVQVTALGNENMLQLANVKMITIDEDTARNLITEVNQQRSAFLDK